MDKNPKHPLKKKKVVQKVNATANHMEGEQEVSSKHKKHTYQLSEKSHRLRNDDLWDFYVCFAVTFYKAGIGVKRQKQQFFKKLALTS